MSWKHTPTTDRRVFFELIIPHLRVQVWQITSLPNWLPWSEPMRAVGNGYYTRVRKGYFQLPLFREMSDIEFALFIVMASLSQKGKPIFPATHDELAEYVRCSRRAISDGLEHLETVSLLRNEGRDNTNRVANVYSLNTEQRLEGETPIRGYETYNGSRAEYDRMFPFDPEIGDTEHSKPFIKIGHEITTCPAFRLLPPFAKRFLAHLEADRKPHEPEFKLIAKERAERYGFSASKVRGAIRAVEALEFIAQPKDSIDNKTFYFCYGKKGVRTHEMWGFTKLDQEAALKRLKEAGC